MSALKRRIERETDFTALKPALDGKGVANTDATALVTEEIDRRKGGRLKVLDFGCGAGEAMDFFNQFPDVSYRGVDIANSPEVNGRTRQSEQIDTYDGYTLPYADEQFDIVFSNQVLEHVRAPDAVFGEIARVLRKGGVFVASVSYLEPYHSYSVFNFTPYAAHRLSEDHGMSLRKIGAVNDGLAMLLRQATMGKAGFSWFAPFHFSARAMSWLKLLNPETANYLRLRFSGQFAFIAEK